MSGSAVPRVVSVAKKFRVCMIRGIECALVPDMRKYVPGTEAAANVLVMVSYESYLLFESAAAPLLREADCYVRGCLSSIQTIKQTPNTLNKK